MVKIALVDKQRKCVAKLEIDPGLLVEAAVLVYDGRYYCFSGLDREDKFYTSVVFMEVNPPVHIAKQ